MKLEVKIGVAAAMDGYLLAFGLALALGHGASSAATTGVIGIFMGPIAAAMMLMSGIFSLDGVEVMAYCVVWGIVGAGLAKQTIGWGSNLVVVFALVMAAIGWIIWYVASLMAMIIQWSRRQETKGSTSYSDGRVRGDGENWDKVADAYVRSAGSSTI